MTLIQATDPLCPRCCSRDVSWDYDCHTYATSGGQWLACMPCDSAIYYFCDRCSWSYTSGLNPRNPRAATNEAKRPPWCPVRPARRRDGSVVAVPGVRAWFDHPEAS